jgi:hypothetical protein
MAENWDERGRLTRSPRATVAAQESFVEEPQRLFGEPLPVCSNSAAGVIPQRSAPTSILEGERLAQGFTM